MEENVFYFPAGVSLYTSHLVPSLFLSIQLLSVDVTHLLNGGVPVYREIVYLNEQLNTLTDWL